MAAVSDLKQVGRPIVANHFVAPRTICGKVPVAGGAMATSPGGRNLAKCFDVCYPTKFHPSDSRCSLFSEECG